VNKPNLIMLCSWVEPFGQKGVFFREQAKLVSENYNLTLVRIDKAGIKKYLKLNHHRNSYQLLQTDVGLHLIVFTCLHIPYIPKIFNKYFKFRMLKRIGKYFDFTITNNTLIHAQSILFAGIWAYEIHKRFGIRYIITEHNQFILQSVSHETINSIRNTIYNAEQFLVVSHDKARQILNNGFQIKFNIVGNYVNEEVFFPSTIVENNVFRIITVGAYVYIKDTQTIFEMLKLVDCEDYSDEIEFIYAGFDGWGGNNTDKIKEILQEFNFKKIKVRLIPLADRTEIAELLRNSNLFVLSSISEGMPVSVMEALASGLPVCTTQCGGVDELINEFNGKIVPIRDYQAMFDFVNKCILGLVTFDKDRISKHLVSEYGNYAFRKRIMEYYTKVLS